MYRFLLYALLMILAGNSPAQNVGIGVEYPVGPLTFGNTHGNKIVFWGNALTPHYGIGIQPGQMQVYTNLTVDNIGFGLGRSGAFAENLRVTGSGRVGIYVQNPSQILDVSGRIKLTAIDTFYYYNNDYWDGFASANMYFNNSANTAVSAKLGLSDWMTDGFPTGTFYGFHNYSSNILRLGLVQVGAGQGRLAVNGSFGEPGQVLRTRGANGAAWWTNMIGPDIYINSAVAYSGFTALDNSLKLFTFSKPDYGGNYDYMKNAYELKSPSKLLVRFRISAQAVQCDFCGPSIFDLVILDNENVVRTMRYTVINGAPVTDKMGSALLNLPAGLHRLKIGGYMVSGPAVQVGGRSSLPPSINETDGMRMVVQVIPSYN